MSFPRLRKAPVTPAVPTAPVTVRNYLLGKSLPGELAQAAVDDIRQWQRGRRLKARVLGLLGIGGLYLCAALTHNIPARITLVAAGLLLTVCYVICYHWKPRITSERERLGILHALPDTAAHHLLDENVLAVGGQDWLDAQQVDLETYAALGEHSQVSAAQIIETIRLIDLHEQAGSQLH